jgi:pimeloyl-ACP methyl ester carboxylesterase
MHPSSHLKQINHDVVAADGESLTLVECEAEGGQATIDGPAFLLIHGFTGDRKVFTHGPLPAALSRLGACVYVGELRGRAQRTRGRAPGTIDAYVNLDCEAFLRFISHRVAGKGVHFIGHSLGGLLGCHLLQHGSIASLTTIGTPLSLPRLAEPFRHLAPLASTLLRVLPASYQLPWNRILNVIAPSICALDAGWATRALQQWAGLANPDRADSGALKHILENAHTESVGLFIELIEMLSSDGMQIRGAAALDAVRSSALPVAAVVGTWDPVAPPYSVSDLKEGAHDGPRRIVAVQASGHFDLAMGHHTPMIAEQLWDFLCQARLQHPQAKKPSTRYEP